MAAAKKPLKRATQCQMPGCDIRFWRTRKTQRYCAKCRAVDAERRGHHNRVEAELRWVRRNAKAPVEKPKEDEQVISIPQALSIINGWMR